MFFLNITIRNSQVSHHFHHQNMSTFIVFIKIVVSWPWNEPRFPIFSNTWSGHSAVALALLQNGASKLRDEEGNRPWEAIELGMNLINQSILWGVAMRKAVGKLGQFECQWMSCKSKGSYLMEIVIGGNRFPRSMIYKWRVVLRLRMSYGNVCCRVPLTRTAYLHTAEDIFWIWEV